MNCPYPDLPRLIRRRSCSESIIPGCRASRRSTTPTWSSTNGTPSFPPKRAGLLPSQDLSKDSDVYVLGTTRYQKSCSRKQMCTVQYDCDDSNVSRMVDAGCHVCVNLRTSEVHLSTLTVKRFRIGEDYLQDYSWGSQCVDVGLRLVFVHLVLLRPRLKAVKPTKPGRGSLGRAGPSAGLQRA